ncbi:MAG: LPXTG cell wall anchor domain-containing protein [Clostridia bacterium]|nr:LPXTG cell wall anchor domain-containing protein [Clostridia bacterium]
MLLGTGDETPVYPYVFGGVGVAAIVILLIFGRKRKKDGKKA